MATSQKQASGATSLAVVALGALLMAPKCGADLTVPTENGAPPRATLYALHGNKVDQVPAGGLHLILRRGEEIIVYISGEDAAGGIRKVSIVESASATCSEGSSGEARNEEVVRVETNEVKPGEVGTTALYTSVKLTGAIECAAGLTPRAKRYSAHGTAENHQGGISLTPKLVVDVELETPFAP